LLDSKFLDNHNQLRLSFNTNLTSGLPIATCFRMNRNPSFGGNDEFEIYKAHQKIFSSTLSPLAPPLYPTIAYLFSSPRKVFQEVYLMAE
jgi:hypothetical protein